MSSSKDNNINDLSLIKKNSSDSNFMDKIFDNNSNIKEDKKREKNEEDEDDEIDNKFGSVDKSFNDDKKDNNNDDENSDDESSGEYELIEDNTLDKKNSRKKEKKKKERNNKGEFNDETSDTFIKDKYPKKKNKIKNKRNNKNELYDDNDKIDMIYSSSDNFIKDKYPKKNKYKKNKINNNEEETNKSTSRFRNDFEVIKKLGQGGEGAVFKAKNKWDQQCYAIKRIIINVYEQGELNEVTDNLKKEVYFLSRNRCPYIVRYYQAWQEDYNKEDFKDESDFEDYDEPTSTIQRKTSFEEKSRNTLEKNETSQKFCYASDGVADEHSSSNDDNEENESKDDDNNSNDEEDEYNNLEAKGLGIWDDDEDELDKNKKKKKKEKNKIWDDDSNDSDDNDGNDNNKNKKNNKYINKYKNKNKSKNKSKKKKKKQVLYIQMELCDNNTLRDAIDKGQLKSDDMKWRLISQILEGVEYIHHNKYIHRDLKPGNIFLDDNYDVKIGDFGLVQTFDKKKEANNNSSSSNLINYNNLQYFNFGGELLTVGIGTKYYCSPEQEKSKNYDSKTDIYSLGIIIFEMFYKFNSLMERDITLRAIKEEQKYPNDMDKKCGKNVSALVRQCTNLLPDKRPTVKELLKSKLIPTFINKQNILIQFNDDFLEKNIKFTNDFLRILIDKKKKKFIEYYNNININNSNNNNSSVQDDLNFSKLSKSKEKKKEINFSSFQ